MLKIRRNAGNKGVPTSRSLSEIYGPRILIILSTVVALAYIVVGDRLVFGHFATFELDATLRAALVGSFDKKNIVPLTVVAIDDATAAPPTADAASWGFTDVTPRDMLVEMLQLISKLSPAVIVVDVDLAGDKNAAGIESGPDRQLQQFLKSYTEHPLVFVKRAQIDADGQVQLARSPFDPVIDANAHLSWAHGLYMTDPDGTVRRWDEWLTVCNASSRVALQSVPIRVLAAWPDDSLLHFSRPPPLVSQGPCRPGLIGGRKHTVIYDEALSRRNVATSASTLDWISAWKLLDERVKRDDCALFFDRVVLIGGTRDGTPDVWRTAVGLLPGVELMANTIRFAPGQLRESAHVPFYSLAFLALFCTLKLLLRPVIAIAAGVAICTSTVYVAGPYATLDAIQTAIVLFVELSVVEECIHLWLDIREFGWRFFIAKHMRASNS